MLPLRPFPPLPGSGVECMQWLILGKEGGCNSAAVRQGRPPCRPISATTWHAQGEGSIATTAMNLAGSCCLACHALLTCPSACLPYRANRTGIFGKSSTVLPKRRHAHLPAAVGAARPVDAHRPVKLQLLLQFLNQAQGPVLGLNNGHPAELGARAGDQAAHQRARLQGEPAQAQQR